LPLVTLKAPSSKKSKTKKTHFPQHKKKQSWKAWVFGNPKSSWKKEKDETRKVHILTARKDFLAPNRIFNNMKVVQNSKRVYLLNLFPIINLYITSTCKKKILIIWKVSPYFCEYPSVKIKRRNLMPMI
jgi:hypothetical protein